MAPYNVWGQAPGITYLREKKREIMPLQTYHTSSQLPIYPENEDGNSIGGRQLCKWPRVWRGLVVAA